MTIILSELILRTRSVISDVPEEMASDILIYEAIVRSNQYIGQIVPATVIATSETYIETCIINLAAYYAYVDYTSLVERELGELPQPTLIRINALRERAVAFIGAVTPLQINPDLSVDDAAMQKMHAIAFGKVPSSIDEDAMVSYQYCR